MSDDFTPPTGNPYSYPEYTPAPKPLGKGFAVSALVLGIVSLVTAIIPLLNLLAWIPALVGIGLGITAIVLALRGKAAGKVMAIVGSVLSVLALVISMATIVNVGNAIDDSVTEWNESVQSSDPPEVAPAPAPTPEPTPEPSEEPEPTLEPEPTTEEPESAADAGIPDGTRSDPLLPNEHSVTFFDDAGDQWAVTVGLIDADGWPEIQAENPFNEQPAEGNVYVIVPIEAARLGVDGASPYFDLYFSFVGPSGQSYNEAMVVLPNDLINVAEMYEGAVASGTVAFEVPASDVDGGTISVNYGWGLDPTFFAAVSE